MRPGQAVNFRVVANGSPPLSYQWLRDGNPISGATQSTYLYPQAGIFDSGSTWSVKISNSAGTITSPTVTLAVVPKIPGISLIYGSPLLTGNFFGSLSVDLSGKLIFAGSLFTDSYTGVQSLTSDGTLGYVGAGNAGIKFLEVKTAPNGRIYGLEDNRTLSGGVYTITGDGLVSGRIGSLALSNASYLTPDALGNLYFIVNSGLQKVSATSGQYLSAPSTPLSFSKLTASPDGTVYALTYATSNGIPTDWYIHKITNSGTLVQIATLNFERSGAFPKDGTIIQASFGTISGLAANNDGNIYLSDNVNHVIREISIFGVRTMVGTMGSSAVTLGDRPGSIGNPSDMIFDTLGDMYVISNGAILKISF